MKGSPITTGFSRIETAKEGDVELYLNPRCADSVSRDDLFKLPEILQSLSGSTSRLS